MLAKILASVSYSEIWEKIKFMYVHVCLHACMYACMHAYIQQQPRVSQVNFWHDVREFPAYDDASSQNPIELKWQYFAFRTRFPCIWFYAFVFSRFEFPRSWVIKRKISKWTISMAMVRTLKSRSKNSQSENSI